MEQLASPGAIRITAATLRLAEGFVQVNPLGPVPVKGIDAPVEVYDLVGAGRVRTRLQAAAARGLSRFVGRDAQMEQLRDAIERLGGPRRHSLMGQAVIKLHEGVPPIPLTDRDQKPTLIRQLS